jgi:hypothetical protein
LQVNLIWVRSAKNGSGPEALPILHISFNYTFFVRGSSREIIKRINMLPAFKSRDIHFTRVPNKTTTFCSFSSGLLRSFRSAAWARFSTVSRKAPQFAASLQSPRQRFLSRDVRRDLVDQSNCALPLRLITVLRGGPTSAWWMAED